VENRQKLWKCRCGERVIVELDRPTDKEVRCPRCGSLVEPPGIQKNKGSSSTDETVMLDIGEMARLAQDGVDLKVSGEWVTLPKKEKKRQSDIE
jgi:DNA-directed RNA polymerase subunit RPC12/RpoP